METGCRLMAVEGWGRGRGRNGRWIREFTVE